MSAEDRQIQAMIEFIERDAQEKVREYADEAQAVYDSEKAKLVEAAKEKVVTSINEQTKAMEINRRVERAMLSKKERMRVMDARGEVLAQLQANVKTEVLKIIKDTNKYNALLAELLLETAVTIASDAVVETTAEDEATVKRLIKATEQAAEKKLGKPIRLTVAADKLNTAEAWGGVVMRSATGRPIFCDNTMAARTRTCFHEQLPTVRYHLFHEAGAL